MSFARLVARSVFLPRYAWNVGYVQTRLPRRAGFSTGSSLPKDAIESRILNVISGFEKVDPAKLSTTSSFANDLGLDSLDAVEVVMAVEEEFGIEIPDAEADEIQTVQQGKNPSTTLSRLRKLIDWMMDGFTKNKNRSCSGSENPDNLGTFGKYVTLNLRPTGQDGEIVFTKIRRKNASRITNENHGTLPNRTNSIVEERAWLLMLIFACQPFLKVGCTLAEAPLYDPATRILHFVDISENKVYHLNTDNLELVSEEYPEPVTCLALRRNGRGLACAAAQGFALLEENSVLKYISKPLPKDHVPHIRFNDGACDSKGRFFAGTIYSKEHDISGKLYRYDPADGSCVIVDEGPFTDCNGIGWSTDGKTLYLTDSYVNIIHAYDYDNGVMSNRRVFVDALAQGLPAQTFCDGFCIDSEGGIWGARWGGSRISRFAANGMIDTEIIFPTALNITACCFGGINNDQLYVTTAHCGANGGDSSQQTRFPDSGHLFLVNLSGKYQGGKWRHSFAG